MSLSLFSIRSPDRAAGDPAGVRAAEIAGLPVRRIGRDDLLAAARETSTSTLLLIEDDVRIDAAAVAAIVRADRGESEIVGGRSRSADGDRFGSMLAPERYGPYGIVLAPLLSPLGERNVDALFTGPIDVIAEGLLLISRALAIELGGYDPRLEGEAALADLCSRARALGRIVRCDPAIVFSRTSLGSRSRRPLEDTALLAERYGALPLHHDPPGVRKRGISREIRLSGGVRMRMRKTVPPVTLVIHGAVDSDPAAFLARVRANDAAIQAIVWADPSAPHLPGVQCAGNAVEAVRAAMERRGDRYLALLDAGVVPLPGWLDRLIEQVEWGSDIAIAVDERAAPARAAVISLRLIPQHLRLPLSGTIADGLQRLADSLVPLRRGMRALDGSLAEPTRSVPQPISTSVIFLAGSKPEVVRSSFEALVGQTPKAREYLVVLPAGAETTRLLIASYPRVTLVPDAMDPGLSVGLNAALAIATGDRILIASDEYLFSPGTIDALFAAFDRDPALGLAGPRSNGVALPQGLFDVAYSDMVEMQQSALARLERFRREMTFIDRITTVALVVGRRVLEEIGGFDERFGINRFAAEDYTLRALAAGYRVAMCDDVFAHRFSEGYSLSTLGHADQDQTLWNAFRRKWSLPSAAIGSYDSTPIVEAGFDSTSHYVALRDVAQTAPPLGHVAFTFLGTIVDESSWGAASDSLRSYFQAFAADDPVRFVLGVDHTGIPLGDVAARLRRLLTAAEIDIDRSMNLELLAFEDPAEMLVHVSPGECRIAFGARDEVFAGIARVNVRSRAGLRSLIDAVGVRS